jgi:hypothetical protein
MVAFCGIKLGSGGQRAAGGRAKVEVEAEVEINGGGPKPENGSGRQSRKWDGYPGRANGGAFRHEQGLGFGLGFGAISHTLPHRPAQLGAT